MSKQNPIKKINKRIQELNGLIADIFRPDWNDLVTERNSLSVDLKRLLQPIKTGKKNEVHMNSINLRDYQA